MPHLDLAPLAAKCDAWLTRGECAGPRFRRFLSLVLGEEGGMDGEEEEGDQSHGEGGMDGEEGKGESHTQRHEQDCITGIREEG